MRRRALGLLIGLALLSTGCALHHRPLALPHCYLVVSGEACSADAMMPQTYCACVGNL